MQRAVQRLQPLVQAMSLVSPSSSLSKFSTCEISDALLKLGVPHGGHIPDIHMFSPSATGSGETRICGPAYTVQMVLGSDTSAPKLTAHFVDTTPPGSVVVVAAPPQVKNAVWGGLMTAGAQRRGALGVIISGRCRDLSEHRSANFPVFARGYSTLGQSPFTRPSAVNVPVSIAPEGVAGAFPKAVVNPGDLILADEDGVVFVPPTLVDKVLELAEKGRAIDAKCMEDIRAGCSVQEAFKRHRGR
ncbi:ribonuclease E inhibitor RraA/Dimethylmenaquinone methyltransferase [Cytidiella melzeri]|nr:ribonuclease E inhibitor RraA/Dimethylmenaquinone methyltransferase [Cytidiella melzeri]